MEQNEIKKMDKMTHVKFNGDNFALSLSDMMDQIMPKNNYGIDWNSLRVCFIALRIAQFNQFSKEQMSDILSFAVFEKHFTDNEERDIFPWIDNSLFANKIFQEIMAIALFVEENLDIKNNFLQNKREIVQHIEVLDIDEIIKENFLYLAELEIFWLELISLRLPFLILDMLDDHTIEISYKKLHTVGRFIAKTIYRYIQKEYDEKFIQNLRNMCAIFNFDAKDTSRVILCGYFYNIGVLKIPVEIVLKQDTLNEVEDDIVKSIPYFSREVLSMIYGFDDIAKLASNYQERIDGSGYPSHLSGSDLPLKDRIFQIVILYQTKREEKIENNEIFRLLENEADKGRIDKTILKTFQTIISQNN